MGINDYMFQNMLPKGPSPAQRAEDAARAAAAKSAAATVAGPASIKVDTGMGMGTVGQSQTNTDGSPIRPGYSSILDQFGNTKPGYELKTPGIDQNSLFGLSAIKSDALRTGPSLWGNTMLLKQQQDQAAANSGAAATAAQGAAQARSGLAMRGGLSEGARRSIANQSMRNLMTAKQGVSAQGAQNRYSTLAQDEQNRMDQLSKYAAAEGGLAQYNNTQAADQQKYNLMARLQDMQGKSGFDLGAYTEELKKWAAAKQAGAISGSGDGGDGKSRGTKIAEDLLGFNAPNFLSDIGIKF